jgi:hypothetical protein
VFIVVVGGVASLSTLVLAEELNRVSNLGKRRSVCILCRSGSLSRQRMIEQGDHAVVGAAIR